MAAGASIGVSRATFDAATRGTRARSVAARSRSAGQAGRAAARAGRVRADAGRLHQGDVDRAACRRRPASSRPNTARRWPRSSRSSACLATCCLRSGVARLISAVTSCRKTPSRCSRPRPITAAARISSATNSCYALKMLEEGQIKLADMRSSWGGAMGLTQFLPSEFYKYAVDFDGDGKSRHLEFGAGCARLGGAATRRQGLAARRCIGPTRCARPRTSIARIGVPEKTRPVAEWLKQGLCAGLWTQAERGRACRAGFDPVARRHLRSGLSHAQELLRDQGIQFLGSLRAVRRASERSHQRPAAIRDAVEQGRADSHRRRSRRCSAR